MSPERNIERAIQAATAVAIGLSGATTSRAEATGYETADEVAREAMRAAKAASLVPGEQCLASVRVDEIDISVLPTRQARKGEKTLPDRPQRPPRTYNSLDPFYGIVDGAPRGNRSVLPEAQLNQIVKNNSSRPDVEGGRGGSKLGKQQVRESGVANDDNELPEPQEQGNRPVELQGYLFVLPNADLSDPDVFNQAVEDPAFVQIAIGLFNYSVTRAGEGLETVYVTQPTENGDVDLTMVRGRVTEGENGAHIEGPVYFIREMAKGGPTFAEAEVPAGDSLGVSYGPDGFGLIYWYGERGVWEKVTGFDAGGRAITQPITGELSMPSFYRSPVQQELGGGAPATPTPEPPQQMATPNAFVLAGYEGAGAQSAEAIVLSEANFPAEARLATSGGEYTVNYSQAVLALINANGISSPEYRNDAAWRAIIDEAYAAVGLPVGSEISLGAPSTAGGEVRVRERITGRVERVTQYVVAADEFRLILEQMRSSSDQEYLEYTPGGDYQVAVIGFFRADGELVIISKTRGLRDGLSNAKMIENVIFDGPATAYSFVFSTMALGQGFRPPSNANNVYYAYGCSSSGCANAEVNIQQSSPSATLGDVLKQQVRRGMDFVARVGFSGYWKGAKYVKRSPSSKVDPFQNV